MSLDLDRLEKPRLRGGKVIARCPACTEEGMDRSGEHLFIADEGRGPFGCIMFPGPAGEAHRQRIWELAGVHGNVHETAFPAPPKPQDRPAKGKPRIPALRQLNVGEMAAIAELRGWQSFAGLELLSRRGLLWQGMVWDDGRECPAWIVTDRSRRNVQGRRMDGEPWSGIESAKAKTLPGCESSWPIGAAEIGERPAIVLCEGGPDFLASLLIAWWERNGAVEAIAPVCVTGAGISIHPDALPCFADRHVRIAVHTDDAGREAGERWARQLYAGGAAKVDGIDFSGLVRRGGQPVKDLADFATLLDPEIPMAANVLADIAICK